MNLPIARADSLNAGIDLAHYYNRFSPDYGWEALLFRAGYVLQSAEVNEMQSLASYRRKQLGDALFKDGDIVRDARANVNPNTGHVDLEEGAVYVNGEIRIVPATTLTVPVIGTAIIGIVLSRVIITEVEDPNLLDPATETKNNGQAGACRLILRPSWMYRDSSSVDESFYPIHYIDDGYLRPKDAPPVLDTTNQAIARYDVDNNGSNYIVSGFEVSMMDDAETGEQVYNINAGRARVMGYGIGLTAGRRLSFSTSADLRAISNEPHQSTTINRQRVNLDRSPINHIDKVSITPIRTVQIIHGTISGAKDPLPDSSVLEIKEIKQGSTTFVQGTDFQLSAGQVDWSLPGAEPAPGSTYDVTYTYMLDVEPEDVDATGFFVTGAVQGTLILTTYTAKLPRIDRICIDSNGQFQFVVGVSTDYNPVPPEVPTTMLALCQVRQTWTDARAVINDGMKMVSMRELNGQKDYIMTLTDMVAQLSLVTDTTTRDGIAMKGMFTDPFLNDDQRDAGVPQSAAVAGQSLTLPIDGDALFFSADIEQDETCAFTEEVILEQLAQTGNMKINPYQAYAPFPSKVTLFPAIDNWVETKTVWASAVTQRFVKTIYAPYGIANYKHGEQMPTGSSTYVETVSEVITAAQFLRQIYVSFEVVGFGAGEQLTSVTFDGIAVIPEAI